jgi:hypothetical protein
VINAPGAPQEPGEPDLPLNIQDLVPALAIGATDAGETAAVLRRAASLEVADALSVYGSLAELLLFSAPPAAAPPSLEARLRAAINQRAPAPGTPADCKPLPSLPAHATAAPTELPAGHRAWHWPPSVHGAAAVAAAASLLLLLLNIYWIRETGALRAAHAALQQQLDAQTARFSVYVSDQERVLQAQDEQLATQDALLAQLVAGESEHYTMQAVQPDSSAVAQVAWLAQENVAILRAEGFPPLGEGQAYQLWLIRGDTRTSGGLFTVDESGDGTYIFHPTQSLDDFDGMGITPEPAGGSPGPTAPPVVRAQL